MVEGEQVGVYKTQGHKEGNLKWLPVGRKASDLQKMDNLGRLPGDRKALDALGRKRDVPRGM